MSVILFSKIKVRTKVSFIMFWEKREKFWKKNSLDFWKSINKIAWIIAWLDRQNERMQNENVNI